MATSPLHRQQSTASIARADRSRHSYRGRRYPQARSCVHRNRRCLVDLPMKPALVRIPAIRSIVAANTFFVDIAFFRAPYRSRDPDHQSGDAPRLVHQIDRSRCRRPRPANLAWRRYSGPDVSRSRAAGGRRLAGADPRSDRVACALYLQPPIMSMSIRICRRSGIAIGKAWSACNARAW